MICGMEETLQSTLKSPSAPPCRANGALHWQMPLLTSMILFYSKNGSEITILSDGCLGSNIDEGRSKPW